MFRYAAVVIVMLMGVVSSSLAVLVDGYCYLESETDHSGTKVLFVEASPSAVTDSMYTDATGYFEIDLAIGIYDVHYLHTGFHEISLTDQNFFSPQTLPEMTLLTSPEFEISGPLSGVLTLAIYLVTGDLSIVDGETLTIEPGTELWFDGMYSLTIESNRTLNCQGTENDSILFLPNTNGGISQWGGIDFQDSSSDDVLEYCRISGGYSDGDGGGIYCNNSSPTISNCTISGNSAEMNGGGINCYYSSPTISYCTVRANSAGHAGAGIYCTSSNPTISYCNISENTSDSVGGGIYCALSGPTTLIIYCEISGNSAEFYGGGICCRNSSSPTISNCSISGNSTGYSGGGIYCFSGSSPMISNCTISGNTTVNYGGGIYCSTSNLTINNSTVTDNMGQGVYVSSTNSDPEVTFCDVYNNSTGNFAGPGINPLYGELLLLNANDDSCDVYMNISLDPLYVDPDNGDFHLTEDSPCIDAGDPDSPFDPDGTVADIGAFFFDQAMLPEITVVSPNGGESWWVLTEQLITWVSNVNDNVSIELYDGLDLTLVIASDIVNDGEFLWTIPADLTPAQNYSIRVFMTSDPTVEDTSDGSFTVLAPPSVTLTAYDPPVVIPSYGGGYWYWMVINNPTTNQGNGNAWSEAILPNGNTFGPLFTLNVSIGPGETYAPALPYGQWVPAFAPMGTYEQVMHIGVYPNFIMDSDSFTFEKLAGVNASTLPEENWSISDWPS